MADENQLKLIKQGVKVWNKWREEHPTVQVDLRGVILRDADLSGANLDGANLSKADLCHAVLSRAHLTGAKLYNTNCFKTDFRQANLTGANLQHASLIETNLEGATLTNCRIYGLSAWNVNGIPNDESNLIITPEKETTITVDNLQVAQFIYLLLNNKNIRDVIDTITSKAVLILGRFTKKRKAILDAIREELRNKHDLTPILFDFDPASNQDITQTVTLLARMVRFVIADITDPMSVQQELTLIGPQVLVAIRPIILKGQKPWSLFDGLKSMSHGILPVYEYTDLDDLLQGLQNNIIGPAEAKRLELLPHHS